MPQGNRRRSRLRRGLSLSLALAGLFSTLAVPSPGLIEAQGQGFRLPSTCSSDSPAEGTIYAVTVNNSLLSFNPGAPGVILSQRSISGLAQGETVVGIDFRPATGQLYAVTSASRIYVINPTSGLATAVGMASFSPGLNGQSFGVDFNPVPDLIRVLSDADQNLRVSPVSGALAAPPDGALAFDAADPNSGRNPNVVAAAYTNSFLGAPATTLFGIDSSLGALVRQGSEGGAPVSPNTGTLFTVGALGAAAATSDLVGFDIAAGTNAAFASLTAPGAGASQLFTVNLATGAARLVGVIGGGQLIRDVTIVTRAESLFAVTTGNRLLSFNSGTPGVLNSARPISGLDPGETVVGIDFRPATGQLYAVTSANQVYTVNPATGAATQVGMVPFSPGLNGQSFGVDFNPVPDLIRVLSDADQNLRVSPVSGALAAPPDGALAFDAADPNSGRNPNVVAAAYTNSFLGAPATTLFGIDSSLGALVRQGSEGGAPVSPNTGTLFTVGALGAAAATSDLVGFDIAAGTNAAFASLTAPGAGASQLFTVNLATGAARLVGTIAGGETIRDVTVGVRVPNIFAVTTDNTLLTFNAGAPGSIVRARLISGLVGNDAIQGIDFRPATGQLYGIGSSSRVYIINPMTGRAAVVGMAPFSPGLNGQSFGVDFNPVPDLIRVLSDADQNLRVSPVSGALAAPPDGALAFDAADPNSGRNPNVVAAAYINSFLGATTTTLFGIDSDLGALVRQGSEGGAPVSPNTGTLFTVGALGAAAATSDLVGFDIAAGTNAAFASLTAPGAGASQLFTVNLNTGAARLVGAIGSARPIRGIAVAGTMAPAFDACIQDDDTGDSLAFDTCTGDYQFTRCGPNGVTLIGRGSITRAGVIVTLRDSKVAAIFDSSPVSRRNSGTAVIRLTPFGTGFTLYDSDTTNNTCACR